VHVAKIETSFFSHVLVIRRYRNMSRAAPHTFSRLGNDSLQFTKSGGIFASIGTAPVSDTLILKAAGGTGNVYLSGVKTPEQSDHAANKAYVDSVAQGLDIKGSVRCASSINLDLALGLSAGGVVDGYTLGLGDRVLVRSQADQTQNGIYIVTSGAASRALDLATGARAAGAFVFVESGDTHRDSGFVCTSDSNADTVGSDGNPLVWTIFSGAGAFIAGLGLSKTGTTFEVNGLFGGIDIVTTGGINLGSNAFVVSGTTGDVSVNDDKFHVIGATGDTAVGGELTVHNKLTVSAGIEIASGGIIINTDKLVVDDATGDTSIGGALSTVGDVTLHGNCDVSGDFDVNGNFRVGGTTGDITSGGRCDVSGDLSIGSSFLVSASSGDVTANSYISTSDGTLKQNITTIPADVALLVVMGMRPVQYEFISVPDDPRVGVIAQEMRVVAPSVVKTVVPPGGSPHLAVNYGDMTAYLIGAIQALQAEISVLQEAQSPR
jgi:hypothetical protein